MRMRTPFLSACVVVTIAVGAEAQTMNFSVYNDAYLDNGTVFLYSAVSDFSSGCSHSGYATTSRIYSPSSRTNASTQSGLYSSTSLSFDAEYGDYAVVTTGNYFCNCSHMTAGFGGGYTLPIPPPPSPPRITYLYDNGTNDEIKNGVLSRSKYAKWQVDRDDGGVWTYGGTVTEDWSGWQNACNIPIGDISGSQGLDGQKQFWDNYYAPKFYLCTQSCVVWGTQGYKLSTYQGGGTTVKSHTVFYSCGSIDVL